MDTLPLFFFLTLNIIIPESHFYITINRTEALQVRDGVRVLPILWVTFVALCRGCLLGGTLSLLTSLWLVGRPKPACYSLTKLSTGCPFFWLNKDLWEIRKLLEELVRQYLIGMQMKSYVKSEPFQFTYMELQRSHWETGGLSVWLLLTLCCKSSCGNVTSIDDKAGFYNCPLASFLHYEVVCSWSSAISL